MIVSSFFVISLYLLYSVGTRTVILIHGPDNLVNKFPVRLLTWIIEFVLTVEAGEIFGGGCSSPWASSASRSCSAIQALSSRLGVKPYLCAKSSSTAATLRRTSTNPPKTSGRPAALVLLMYSYPSLLLLPLLIMRRCFRGNGKSNALAVFINRPASCCLNRRITVTKKPTQPRNTASRSSRFPSL